MDLAEIEDDPSTRETTCAWQAFSAAILAEFCGRSNVNWWILWLPCWVYSSLLLVMTMRT
jgi:hypothetical protein